MTNEEFKATKWRKGMKVTHAALGEGRYVSHDEEMICVRFPREVTGQGVQYLWVKPENVTINKD